MLTNVSFGILVVHPIGWALMLAVIVMEWLALRRCLIPAESKSNGFGVSLAANAVSGLIGLVLSIGIRGGWWLVVWVPWVTANEASSPHWPRLATFMAVAYVGSVLIETMVVKGMLPTAPTKRVWAVVAAVNLASSIFLTGVFWMMGGVPGR